MYMHAYIRIQQHTHACTYTVARSRPNIVRRLSVTSTAAVALLRLTAVYSLLSTPSAQAVRVAARTRARSTPIGDFGSFILVWLI